MLPLRLFGRVEALLFLTVLLASVSCRAQETANEKFPTWFRVYRLLDTTRLGKVEIEKRTVIDAVKVVRDEYARQNGHSFAVIVNPNEPAIRDDMTERVPESRKVTLKERNISALEALKQIAEQTRLELRIEEFGITLANAPAPSDSRTARFDVPIAKRKLLEHLPPQVVDIGPLRQIAFDRTTGVLSYRDARRDFEIGLRVLEVLGIGEMRAED